MTGFKTTPFYSEVIDGGAITCDLPVDWKDVSEIRQVPDHQEVYVGPGDDDPCFIIEILEYQDSVPDEEAAKYFFDDLAASNGSSKTSFFDQPPVAPADGSAPLNMFVGVGMQRFGRGRDRNGNVGNPQPNQDDVDVEIELCVVRLRHVETDLLLTMSRTKGRFAADTQQLSEEFRRVLSTIQILDWDLFGA